MSVELAIQRLREQQSRVLDRELASTEKKSSDRSSRTSTSSSAHWAVR